MRDQRRAGIIAKRSARWNIARLTLRLFSMTVFFALARSEALASMTCKRIDQLPLLSEPAAKTSIEKYVQDNYPSKAFKIYQLDNRHYVLQPADADCQAVACYYHLIQINAGTLIEPFAFHGTGIVWIILSPVNIYFEQMNDRYSVIAVETANKGLINIALPLTKKTVLIETLSIEETKILRCPSTQK